jgi:hypothetical protein
MRKQIIICLSVAAGVQAFAPAGLALRPGKACHSPSMQAGGHSEALKGYGYTIIDVKVGNNINDCDISRSRAHPRLDFRSHKQTYCQITIRTHTHIDSDILPASPQPPGLFFTRSTLVAHSDASDTISILPQKSTTTLKKSNGPAPAPAAAAAQKATPVGTRAPAASQAPAPAASQATAPAASKETSGSQMEVLKGYGFNVIDVAGVSVFLPQ